jgi:CRP-like cAMP-binding protein
MAVEPMTFEDREVLFRPGDMPAGIFIIESGEVDVFRQAGDKTVSMARLKPGEIVGELAMINDKPHIRGARAIGLVDCLRISPEQFKTMMDDSPAGMRMILRGLVRKLHKTNTIAYGKNTPTPPSRS